MKKNYRALLTTLFLLSAWGLVLCPAAASEEKIEYSCSAQIFEAFETERLDAFTRETGIPVKLYVASSSSSLNRLMNGYSDIASSTRELYYRHQESGYKQIPFCRDPLAVVTHKSNPVSNITSSDLRGIFSGTITNWKDLGGPDQEIVVVVPGRDTGAYKNFLQVVMDRDEITYDLMTYKSTMVIETVQRFPWAVSFIAQGAVLPSREAKKLQIDGWSPGQEEYPYYQLYSFVTRGEPSGGVKAFIDFAFSEQGRKIAEKRGMRPLPCPR